MLIDRDILLYSLVKIISFALHWFLVNLKQKQLVLLSSTVFSIKIGEKQRRLILVYYCYCNATKLFVLFVSLGFD